MPEKDKKKPVQDKIVIDTLPPKSGSCVYHNFLYALLGLGGALYLAFILDRASFDEYSKQYSYLGTRTNSKNFIIYNNYMHWKIVQKSTFDIHR